MHLSIHNVNSHTMHPKHMRAIYRTLHTTHYKTTTTTIHTITSHTDNKAKQHSSTSDPVADNFTSIIQACSDSPTLKQAQQLHAQCILHGLIPHNALIGAKLMGMYVLSHSFSNARNLFYHNLNLRYAASWNWMIRMCTMMDLFDFAILWYFKMVGYGTWPDKYTFTYVVKACGRVGNVGLGRFVHCGVREMGFEEDVFVGSALIKMYADRGFLGDARGVFDKMAERDVVLWNVMLNGYVRNGEVGSVVEMFEDMRRCGCRGTSVTFVTLLSVCDSEVMAGFGAQLHGLVVGYGLEMDSAVSNTLLAMYCKCRQLFDADKLFGIMMKSDLVTWNIMVGGYVQNGFMNIALRLFQEMLSAGLKPDSVTFSSYLPSVSDTVGETRGKEIHGYIIRHDIPLDVFLKSALIDVYFKCRDVEMASKVFVQSTTIDIVICTTMISGYVLNGMKNNALEIFRWLLKEEMVPNSTTLASVLPAFSGLAALKVGMELHGYILKKGLEGICYVGSAITDMYAKCGRLDLAYHIFHRISERDAVCWNSMITSCSQNGKPEDAISLFRQMGMDGIKYDCVSISAVLSACASLPALYYGKEIHGFMIRNAFVSDLFAESALIDMYGKCGNLESASHVFRMMQHKSEVSWNSIISAYGNHGRLKESLSLFHEMLENGIQPDHVTFLVIMSACGHVGEVDTGVCYFHFMREKYGILARKEHYACIVDMLGRAGRLSEAFQTIKSMPFVPDAGIWGTLLGACRVHGNVKLAEVASEHLFNLDPQNSGYYMLLSHTHAYAGEWSGVLEVNSMMKERGVHKVPGYSWIK